MTDNLRALALAATPELKTALRNAAQLAMHLPWERPGDAIPFQHKQEFRDLATPEAITALLDEIADHERAYELLFKECGELRKDAERYRHIVKFRTIDCAAFYWSGLSKNKGFIDDFIDDFIDAAKGESHAD